MASLPFPKSQTFSEVRKLIWEAIAYGSTDKSLTRFTRGWIDQVLDNDCITIFEEMKEHGIWIMWRIYFEF